MANSKKFAVILSGCGVFDGSEIHEATLSLYAISKQGGSYEIFAPNIKQYHVINHLNGEVMNEERNVLIESARIARGKIKALTELNLSEIDGILLPGGFGAAKNLSTWAFKGPESIVLPELEKLIRKAVEAKIPIGALCISPVILAKVIKGANITIGYDKATAEAVEKTGGKHSTANHGEVIIDEKHKLFTTPCYMLEASIAQIGEGAENIVREMLKIM